MVKQIPAKLGLLISFTLLVGCRSAPEASPPPRASQAPEASPEQAASPQPETAGSDSLRFILEEGGRRQTLELRKREGGGFDAAISVAGGCSRAEAGSAKEVTTEGDTEVEADPDGEGHPTDSFTLTAGGECQVTIRLAAPEREYAWLREADCPAACPLSNKPMIRK